MKHKISKKLRNDISNATYRKNAKDDFHIDIKTLKRLYRDIGLSQHQIADIFGITQTCVYHKLVEFRISTKKDRKRKSKKKRISPNSYEQKIIDLCAEMKYPFKFVGNLRNVIDGKSPDFISSDGSTRIIETFSKYRHKKDYLETRSKFFEDRGFEILFLSDDDLNVKNWKERCIKKINMFLNDNDLNKKEWKDGCKMKIEKFMEDEKNG